MFGLTRLKTCSVAVAFALATWVGAAQATTVSATCGDDSWDRSFTLSSDDPNVVSIACYSYGTTKPLHDPVLRTQIESDGYVYTGTVDETPSGDITGFEDLASLLRSTEGSFDLSAPVDAVLVFKMRPSACMDDQVADAIKCQPVYSSFEITTTGAALLNFESSDIGRGIGHVSIFIKPALVPLPAAGLMLLGGLGALGAAKRRRKAA